MRVSPMQVIKFKSTMRAYITHISPCAARLYTIKKSIPMVSAYMYMNLFVHANVYLCTLHNFAPTVRIYLLYTFRPYWFGHIYVQTFCDYTTLIYCKILHRPPIYQKNCSSIHTIFSTERNYISKFTPTFARCRRKIFFKLLQARKILKSLQSSATHSIKIF